MSGWHRKHLGDGMTAWEPLGQIEAQFESIYRTAGSPKEMAIYYRHQSEGRLHCEVIVYFPPATQALASMFHAEPCPRPAPASISLLAGSNESWSVLFD
jgi:hypothetical protein